MNRLDGWIMRGNAACTVATGLALVPAVLVYPNVASALSSSGPDHLVGRVAWDAALCFGPLGLPALLALGGLAVLGAWRGERDAARWNRVALLAWTAAATGAGALIGVA